MLKIILQIAIASLPTLLELLKKDNEKSKTKTAKK